MKNYWLTDDQKTRSAVKDYVLLMSGAPVLPLEITDAQINWCVDQSIKFVTEYIMSEKLWTYITNDVSDLPCDVGVVVGTYYRQKEIVPGDYVVAYLSKSDPDFKRILGMIQHGAWVHLMKLFASGLAKGYDVEKEHADELMNEWKENVLWEWGLYDKDSD